MYSAWIPPEGSLVNLDKRTQQMTDLDTEWAEDFQVINAAEKL